MTVLQIKDLAVGYGRQVVLNNVDLTVRAGEMVALLGENGSGKSTLLRTIAGDLAPLGGEISVGGISLGELSVKRRAALVSFMAQEIPAVSGICGMDWIEMSFYHKKGLFGRLSGEERDAVRRMAEHFSLGDLPGRDLSAMSVGERQMVMLMGAALQDAPLLLLDEPTSALDFNRTDRLFAFLQYLQKKGKAIVIVLHDPSQALRHATKLFKLVDGGGEMLEHTAMESSQLTASLREIYPGLRIHSHPLFCYTDATDDLT